MDATSEHSLVVDKKKSEIVFLENSTSNIDRCCLKPIIVSTKYRTVILLVENQFFVVFFFFFLQISGLTQRKESKVRGGSTVTLCSYVVFSDDEVYQLGNTDDHLCAQRENEAVSDELLY